MKMESAKIVRIGVPSVKVLMVFAPNVILLIIKRMVEILVMLAMIPLAQNVIPMVYAWYNLMTSYC